MHLNIKLHLDLNILRVTLLVKIHIQLVDHNDRYYYLHRVTLSKDYEKHILDEFQQLDVPRKLDCVFIFFHFQCL